MVVQVTVTLVTSAAAVEILVDEGFWSTSNSRAVILVTISAQVVAVALATRREEERVEAVVLAAVSPAELAVRAAALAVRSELDSEQAEMAFRPSSSKVLHSEKLPLQ